jgi:hypothetical protein
LLGPTQTRPCCQRSPHTVGLAQHCCCCCCYFQLHRTCFHFQHHAQQRSAPHYHHHMPPCKLRRGPSQLAAKVWQVGTTGRRLVWLTTMARKEAVRGGP